MIDKLNLFGGKITYNDFNIDQNLPFNKQIYEFKEDILQIQYDENYLIDVGWYPEFDPKGYFIVRVIKNYDWEIPLFEKKTQELDVLMKYLQEAIEAVTKEKK